MTQPEQLSQRETDVVELLRQGKSNKQIALTLGISTSTVEYHLTNVYKKLQVNSRTEAVLKLGKSPSKNKLGESIVERNASPDHNSEKSILAWRLLMNKKGMIGFCFLALVLFAITLFMNTPNQDTRASNLQVTDVGMTATTLAMPTITATLTPVLKDKTPTSQGTIIIQTEKVANIDDKVLTLKGAEIYQLSVNIIVCVFSPDQQQWFPNVSLLYKGDIFNPTSAALTDTKPSPGDELCYRMNFPLQIDPVDDPKQAIAVWVTKLTKDQPERLSNETISSAFQALSVEGIEFSYIMANHGMRIEITKKPEGITDEEASIMIQKALTEEALPPSIIIFGLE